jgi:beta-ureidopropionase
LLDAYGVVLQEYIPAEKLSEVKRVLFGANQGKPVTALQLPASLQQLAEEQAFDLQAYKFGAAAEQFRAPRTVKIGLIQNAVVKPTTAPFADQRQVGEALNQQPCMHGNTAVSAHSYVNKAFC